MTKKCIKGAFGKMFMAHKSLQFENFPEKILNNIFKLKTKHTKDLIEYNVDEMHDICLDGIVLFHFD